ncbi:MAG: pirin family protein [Xanthomonadaceae bacterium]|jgi:redox-sensitive bicupin YhaK (pirin superfamily)|nr:pirin family protein [Xanthomonadaceae bacterium]
MSTDTIRDTYTHVIRKVRGQATSDGAGVKLVRVIGGPQLPDLDPFLMLDEFGTDRPEDYIGGFPEHPHRGFDTVTYMLEGRMRHRDNHGNEGLLTSGAVQWMTAGSGLVHSEMPEQESGRMRGFQLWINLPANLKMTQPRYQEFAAGSIPVAHPADGVTTKVIAGHVGDVVGPIAQPSTDPTYLDVGLDAGTEWEYELPAEYAAFLYPFAGSVIVGEGQDARTVETQALAVLGGGSRLRLKADGGPVRMILLAGRPLREPIVRYGPFVMSTKQDLMQAFVDYQEGRF